MRNNDLERLTNKGMIKGLSEDGLLLFRGIPYAAAPVGDLRFKRAVEHEEWEGTLNCTEFGAKCWQFGGGKFQQLCDSNTPESEDCLFLNVWTKENYKDRPVFVWVHGGGQYCGEASSPDYDLKAFARDGIVAVSLNYRLGALGFYDFSKYGSDFESNCAISDIIQALKWVKENIAAFGGNPDNITLCGESGGATCVMSLLGAPSALDYFNRVIVMSGVLFNITGKQIQDYNRNIFFEQTGLEESEAKQLLTMDYEMLRKGCKCRFEGLYKDKPGMLTAGPVIDDIIVETPIEALESGHVSGKEIMIGTCKNEAGLFNYMNLSLESFARALEVLYINGYTEKVNDFTLSYNPGVSGSDQEKKAISDFLTDMRFWAGSVRFARAAAKNNIVYMYRFDYETPVAKLLKMGATHTMDIAAAFDNKGSALYKFALDDSQVKKNLHSCFVNFTEKGNPNGEGLATWTRYNEEEAATMLVNKTMKLVLAPREEFYQLWSDIELY